MEPLMVEGAAAGPEPRRSSTRAKTVLLAGLALVAVACWAPWHPDTVLVTGAFSGALSRASPAALRGAPATVDAARTAEVGMALDTDHTRRSVLAALGGLAVTAPWPANAASVLDPPQKADPKGQQKKPTPKPAAKPTPKPAAKPTPTTAAKKPTPKPTPKPAPKKKASVLNPPNAKKAPAKRKNQKKKKGGGLGGLVLPAAVLGGGYLLLNDEEGEGAAPAAPAPAEDGAAESED